MFTFNEFLSLLWNPRFWLPPGENWEFLKDVAGDEYYANFSDLYTYPMAVAIGLHVFRLSLEKYCFKRLGVSLGLKNVKNKKAPFNPVLEKAFKAGGKWGHKEITSLSKHTDWSERQIERWLRLRKMQGKSFILNKFSENCWRCFYYFNIVIYGLITLWTKPWFWHLDFCWVNYPRQGLSSDIWWYFMVSLSFNWYLLALHFSSDEKFRFCSLLDHYLIAIIILSLSWICNLHRIGCVLIFTHDLANVALEAGKSFKCAKNDLFTYISSYLFVISWFLSRLIYMPFWIISNVLFRAPIVIGKIFPAYYLFISFLISLQIFYLYHAYFVLIFSFKLLTQRKIHFLS